MAGSGKKRTTMAKLNRESRLRERRLDKQAKKDARKLMPGYDQYAPAEIQNVPSDRTGSAPDR
jgi:hypothetical protein